MIRELDEWVTADTCECCDQSLLTNKKKDIVDNTDTRSSSFRDLFIARDPVFFCFYVDKHKNCGHMECGNSWSHVYLCFLPLLSNCLVIFCVH